MNADLQNAVKQYATCLDNQEMQQHAIMTPHEISSKLWEIFGADSFL